MCSIVDDHYIRKKRLILDRKGRLVVGVQIINLNKIYPDGTKALEDINLNIERCILGLLGPNGAGKSTLMKILTTVLSKTKGIVKVFEHDVDRDREKIRALIGYLPQEYGLYNNLTAVEFLDYIGLFYQISSSRVRKRKITCLLDKVNLLQAKGKMLGTYSGGMKRRLGIAQALLNDPKVLIVDEPTAGLDPEERIKFRNLLRDLLIEDKDRVVILSTHIVSDITALCSRVAILNKGRLVYDGMIERLLQATEGRVWELRTGQSAVKDIECRVNIINSKVESLDSVYIRYVSDDPIGDSQMAVPELEDAYMYLLGKGNGNER